MSWTVASSWDVDEEAWVKLDESTGRPSKRPGVEVKTALACSDFRIEAKSA